MTTNDELEYESWQFQRVRELSEQIAEECPWMWRIADGMGGFIFNEIKAAYARRGYEVFNEGSDLWGNKRKAIPPKIRAEIFRRDKHACLSCGATSDLSIDHIVPVSKGGRNDLDNLQTLCMSCNLAKGIRTMSYLGSELVNES